MPEINYADSDRQIMNCPTDDQIRRQAATHRAYGWAPCPWGHWDDRQKAVYAEAFQPARDGR